MDGMLSYLEKVLEAKNIFERKRKKTSSRALGILLYHLGVSLRNCHEVVSSFEPVSHEAVRLWYHKAEGLFYVEKAFRRIIAIDETKIKINGKWYILWAAIDVDTWEVLGVWITQGRASIEAYSFIRHVLTKCENNPKILVDGGPWYKPALKRLGVDWEHVTFGLRNPIEQWFGILKHRINLFYNRWPHNASVESAQAWINAFVSMYHLRRC
jgi:transposase-like protein